MKRVNCYRLLLFIIVVCCLLSMIACSGNHRINRGKDGKGFGTSKSLPNKLIDPNISILIGDGEISGTVQEVIINTFEEKYGGKVKITTSTSREMNTKIITSVSSGEPFDVVNWSEDRMPNYVIKGILQPLDDYLDLTDPLWEDELSLMAQYMYKGKYYGIVRGTTPFMVFYNKTLFENNGLKTPLEYYKEGNWDWDTLRKLGMALTQDLDRDGVIDQWGFAARSLDEMINFVSANNADFVNINDDGTIVSTLKSDGVIDALQYYQDGLIVDKFIPLGGNAQALFPVGKLSMFAQHGGFIKGVLKDGFKDEWDVAPYPPPKDQKGDKHVVPGNCGLKGIPSGAKNPEGAAAFLYIDKVISLDDEIKNEKEVFTPEQIQLIQEFKKRVNFTSSIGIGELKARLQALKKELEKGAPIMGLVEKYAPVFQTEIDITMKDIK